MRRSIAAVPTASLTSSDRQKTAMSTFGMGNSGAAVIGCGASLVSLSGCFMFGISIKDQLPPEREGTSTIDMRPPLKKRTTPRRVPSASTTEAS